jgi:carbamate kinase
VPSPRPVEIVEAHVVKRLAEAGVIVIAAGGGGIPVVRDAEGRLTGERAVVDKDLASALLAREIGLERLIILTSVERVCVNFGQPDERPLESLTVEQAKLYLDAGQFPEGSMGPKIRAAIEFLEAGGREVLIASPHSLQAALKGETGTRIAK